MRDDLTDARFIHAALNAAREWERATGRTLPQKPLREALWFVWQQPRLGRRVRGKYPIGGPWTAGARMAYEADPRAPLIIEHVEPIAVLLRRLLDHPLAVAELVVALQTSALYCVVTPEESRALESAGFAKSTGPDSDPWSRYRAAGIDVDGIRPLREEP